MPCNDITENIVISFSNDAKIKSYAIRKKTCGAKVGNQSLLLDWVCKIEPNTLLNMYDDEFVKNETYNLYSEYDKFIALKHFRALKLATSIILGKESGNKNSEIIIDLIEQTENGFDARMFIGVNLDPTQNPGCGAGGCGSGKCGR